MGPIRFNACDFCCIYFLNNKNLECRHTSIKRCYMQVLQISFQYLFEKVLIWKLFMLLVESPFAGRFFPFKRLIEKVLIWIVFNLLVFLFAGCLFLEVPSFSGQYERKIQSVEWGPLDLECRFTWIKRFYTQGLHNSFHYFVENVLIWKLFMLLVESPFVGWFFPFKLCFFFFHDVLLSVAFQVSNFLETSTFQEYSKNMECGPCCFHAGIPSSVFFAKAFQVPSPKTLKTAVLAFQEYAFHDA